MPDTARQLPKVLTPEQFRNLHATGRLKARGKLPKRIGMNKTEAEYQAHLELQQRAGELAWYAFEAIKLRLAPKTFLTVDFFVMRTNGAFEAHEVKGFWRDDARVKIKVAAAAYPFRFLAVKKRGDAWAVEEF